MSLLLVLATRAHADCPQLHVGSVGTSGSGPGGFVNPTAVARHGNLIYVSDRDLERVQIFSPDGAVVGSIVGDIAGFHFRVDDLDTQSDGTLLALSSGARRLYRFTPSGSLIGYVPLSPSAAIERFSVDGLDGIHLLDYVGHRIFVLNPDASPRDTLDFGSLPIHRGDIAVTGDGGYWRIVDDSRIARLDATGAELFRFGTGGGYPGQFFGATAVAVDAAGHLWVSDPARVQEFTDAGGLLSITPMPILTPTGNEIRNMDIDAAGRVTTIDYRQRKAFLFDVAPTDDCPVPGPPVVDNPAPMILLSLRTPTASRRCITLEGDCPSATTAGRTLVGEAPYYLLDLVAVRGHDQLSIASVNVGIDYDGRTGHGVDIYEFTECTPLLTPTPNPAWPAAGSGMRFDWDVPATCPMAPTVSCGWFYLGAYGPDTLRVVPPPGESSVEMVTCDGVSFQVPAARLGFVVFTPDGATAGCNPCEGPCPVVTTVERVTWSGIKRLLGR